MGGGIGKKGVREWLSTVFHLMKATVVEVIKSTSIKDEVWEEFGRNFLLYFRSVFAMRYSLRYLEVSVG